MQVAVTAPETEHIKPKASRFMPLIALLAAAGIAVSCFSLYHHFSHSQTSFCDIGQEFNCDLVNRSQYSVALGVPVALVGILGYLLLLAFATVYRQKAETPFLLLIASLAGLGFALRLAYIEAFVLHTWCILCLSSLAIIFAIVLLCSWQAAQVMSKG
jgi:uncharacterized membrane protein